MCSCEDADQRQARRGATRAVNNENDENAQHARVTRAKSAAQGAPDELSEGVVRKALQSKKAGTNALNGVQAQRKRAALGDLSNVAKGGTTDNIKEEKKLHAKASVTKVSQVAGVQKAGRTAAGRATLGTKEANKKGSSADLKRPASGSGVMGAATKKRSTGSTASQPSVKEDAPLVEVAPPQKKVMKVEVQETVTIEQEDLACDEDVIDGTVHDIEVPDLDADDLEDPLMVAEYAPEIFDYLRNLEEQTVPNASYMDHQDHCEWTDRDILNDWLVQVHQRFQLLPETLYLAINIIDRFLSQKIVQLDKLQLVGITSLFIASKYEEVISPHVSNFTYMAKDYQDSEILSAERFILSTLNYDLSFPNPMNFLRRISKADTYDIQTRTLGKYLLEISALDHRFLEYLPSHVAAASMFMSRMILERGEWVCAYLCRTRPPC